MASSPSQVRGHRAGDAPQVASIAGLAAGAASQGPATGRPKGVPLGAGGDQVGIMAGEILGDQPGLVAMVMSYQWLRFIWY